MSGASKVRETALAHGWGILLETPGRLVVYRWLPGIVRREVCFVLDAAGRIEAVTEWENRRVSIDTEPGCRARAESFLVSAGSGEEEG